MLKLHAATCVYSQLQVTLDAEFLSTKSKLNASHLPAPCHLLYAGGRTSLPGFPSW
jgi:hypothetical protein